MVKDEEYAMHKAHATAVIQELLDQAFQLGLNSQARDKTTEYEIRMNERRKCCTQLDEWALPFKDRTVEFEPNDPLYSSILRFQTAAFDSRIEAVLTAHKRRETYAAKRKKKGKPASSKRNK